MKPSRNNTYYPKKYNSNVSNYHENFLDLEEVYDRHKKRKVKRIATRYIKLVGEKLIIDTEQKARENFRKQVYEGRRISLNDLKRMTTKWKSDYMSEIVNYDDRVT